MYSPRGEQKGGLRPGTVWGGVAARSSPWCAKRQTHASIEGGREGEDLGVCWVPGIVVWVRRGAEIPTPLHSVEQARVCSLGAQNRHVCAVLMMGARRLPAFLACSGG